MQMRNCHIYIYIWLQRESPIREESKDSEWTWSIASGALHQYIPALPCNISLHCTALPFRCVALRWIAMQTNVRRWVTGDPPAMQHCIVTLPCSIALQHGIAAVWLLACSLAWLLACSWLHCIPRQSLQVGHRWPSCKCNIAVPHCSAALHCSTGWQHGIAILHCRIVLQLVFAELHYSTALQLSEVPKCLQD